MREPHRKTLRGGPLLAGLRWLLLALLIAFTGVLYMLLFEINGPLLIGAVYALACSMPLIAFESGRLMPRLQVRLRRLATPAYFLSTLALYLLLSGLGFALAGVVLKTTGIFEAGWKQVLVIRPPAFLYTLVMFFFGITVLRVLQLLGRRVFLSLLTGRYRHPVEEERVFLFLDIVGSSAYARQYGDLKAQAFIGAVFAALAYHVRRHRGEIDDYVGDCAIITWPMKEGVEEARCVRCIYDMLNEVDHERDWWMAHFGLVPQLSAALHGGSIVTAEIGVFHHKITYFGDVVNTTSRIEGLCKTLKKPHLISADLLARLTLPPDIVAEPQGEHMVKGRDEPVCVLALRRLTAGAQFSRAS
ncbi:adenylate/guanylate cyclase domain-containing protein [Rhizobium sp. SGZ-381]|uniref:adenylate/guanylate cyclase domain-containing protein n=1 Tax=Rhizobium sp. SGZ-381 TaxID=3342800 RepID=UPI00366DECAB